MDGKTLRGGLDAGEKQSLVLTITHETREVVGQARQIGSKSSKIPIVRTLLQEFGLEKQKVSLDAHYCNPKTTAQIHQAGGSIYINSGDGESSGSFAAMSSCGGVSTVPQGLLIKISFA